MYAILNGSKVYKITAEHVPNSIACPEYVEENWIYTGGGFQPPPGSLAFARNQKLQHINMLRSTKLNEPVTYNTYQFDTDAKSLANITSLLTALQVGVPLPDNFTWRTTDNQNVPFTQEDLIALAAILINNTNNIYQQSWAKKAEIEAATTLEELNAITW